MRRRRWAGLDRRTLMDRRFESRKKPKRMQAKVPVTADRKDASARALTEKYSVRYVERYPYHI